MKIWCIGMICPIYIKSGARDDPDNYRGIALLSCLGKLFTCCLNTRLYNYMYIEHMQILGNEQAGFRTGYSTIDHIFTLHTLIKLYLNTGKRIYSAFIDHRKAFDYVNRMLLWKSILKYNINGKVFSVFLTCISPQSPA